ncbi:MAG: MFS transporter [Alphaproteobacteria bacterium]|nr:MFS transporter [Alphaproteobacteria bacterium]
MAADAPLARETHFDERSYGWTIVAVVTMAQALGFGVNITVAVFIGPWEAEFGWTRADTSLAYTVTTIGAAMGGLLFGTLSDRIGAKRIALFGACVTGAALIVLSRMNDLSAIYVVYFIMGMFGFGCLFTPLLALTGLWFNKRKGMAIGIVTAGGAIGQGVVPFVLRLVITASDWRTAAFGLGVVFLVALLPLLMLLRTPPVLVASGAQVSRSNDNLWGLPHQLTLPWLAFAGTFCCICMSVPLIHLVPLATSLEFSPQMATGLLLALMTSGMIGRIGFGIVADRIGGLKTYFVASIGQTASVFWFTQTSSLALLFALAIVFGFFFAGVMTSLLIATREAAPLRMVGFATAIVSTAAWLGMAIGSYQGGYFYDMTGGYTLSYGNAALAGMFNLAIVALLIWYRSGRRGRMSEVAEVSAD